MANPARGAWIPIELTWCIQALPVNKNRDSSHTFGRVATNIDTR